MGKFKDERGTILDLEGRAGVTEIHTVKGAVRGNHYHLETTQWTLVTSGLLLMADWKGTSKLRPGRAFVHPPGDPHAWKALRDTTCLVFTLGPRCGDAYESDTYRLKEPLL